MDGIIIIDKEKGWTSNDIVQKIKHIYNEKTGHTGTLDPLATGVLPILIGKGTGLSKYLVNHDKEYVACLKLGVETTTGDQEGEVVSKKDVKKDVLNKKNIEKVLRTFVGKSFQIPPMYSAVKVKGKKLYEYARSGQTVNVEPREIEIYEIFLVEVFQEKIIFKLKCSKGTYIRTLCEDIAKKLNTVGYMKDLRRTMVGDFSIKQAVKVSDINIDTNIITIEDFFKNKKEIKLGKEDLKRFLNGVKISISDVDGVYRVYDESSNFVGSGVLQNKRLKRELII